MTRGHRWTVGLVAAVTLTGFGLLFASPTLFAAAIVPLVFVLYGTLATPPTITQLEATRSIQPRAPEPGEPVTVALTVQNTGDDTLPDVRVIDGVPAELAVTNGAPRGAKPLPPGESLTVEYTVVAKRGEFTFDPATVRLRSIAGGDSRTTELSVAGESILPCANSVQEPPLDNATLPRAGTLPTDSGGSGLEFYATRQYRPGDPMNRVDWRHYAKTGQFVTIQYREEQAARTVLVVDARGVGRVTPAPGYPTGTALCAYAGERLYDALDQAGVVSSVTAIGLDAQDLDGILAGPGLPWIDQDLVSRHGIRPAALFREVQAVAETNAKPVSLTPPQDPHTRDQRDRLHDQPKTTATARTDGWGDRIGSAQATANVTNTGTAGNVSSDNNARRTEQMTSATSNGRGQPVVGGDQIMPQESGVAAEREMELLLERLPPNAQVILCSPVLDNWPVTLGHELATRGYPFVVVSPDVLHTNRAGQRLAAIHRRLRLRTIDQLGSVVSWNPEQPINYAIHRSLPHLFSSR